MKKACALLLALMLLCLCAGCGSSPKAGVTPPSRTGNAYSGGNLGQVPHYTLESAYGASDVVAHVKVGNWLGDTAGSEHFGDFTYFEATAVKTYKGELPEPFVLVQDGTSERTLMETYPLFTYGDELLVFLKSFGPFEDAGDAPYWDNSYCILCSYLTFLDAAHDEAGNVYFMDRFLNLGDRTDLPNYQNVDPELCKALYAELSERDPIFKETEFGFQKVFSEKDVEQLFISIAPID